MSAIRLRAVFSVALLLLLLNCDMASAQTVIINIPSTDVVARNSTYVEFDLLTHPASFENGGYRTWIPRVVYGLRKDLEVGLNVSFTQAFAPDQPVEIQPNLKWRYFGDEKRGLSASVGGILFVPVKNTQGTDRLGMLYTNFGKKVQGKFGPRATGGIYGLVGASASSGTRVGATVGYEQPLHSKVTFLADWFSGKNRFGYVSGGVAVTPTSRTLLGAAYIFGNQGRGNNGLFLYAGYTF